MTNKPLNEMDPFKVHGFSLTKHIYLTPKQKRVILTKRKRVIDPHKVSIPRDKSRKTTIYQHDGEYYGEVSHMSDIGHPLDTNHYLLNKIAEKPKKGTKVNKAKETIAKVNEVLDDIPVLEGSIDERSATFSMRAYDPTTQKSLFKAGAENTARVKSLLDTAKQHMQTHGLTKMNISVQNHKTGQVSDHKLSKQPDGSIHVKGPDVENYFD